MGKESAIYDILNHDFFEMSMKSIHRMLFLIENILNLKLYDLR